MSRWPKVALSDCLQQTSDIVPVERDREYPNFGIYSYARGLFHKRPINGLASSALTLRRVRRRQFIYSRLFAFEGAYGVVGDDFDGCFVSNEYPTFDCDETRILPEYLMAYFSRPQVWEAVARGSKGLGVRRQRVQPEHILAHEIPLAPLSEQRTIVERLDAVREKTRQVAAKLNSIETDLDAICRGLLFAPSKGVTVMRSMREFLTFRQPEVQVDRNQTYHFAGVYSFGRGLFRGARKRGEEFAYERLSSLHAGDFTYPKLMAWEGGLGIVPSECEGLVVSPEFPVFTVKTDVVLPEVLDVYFKTPQVWSELAAISSGTNQRRRRLQPTAFLNYQMPVPTVQNQVLLKDVVQRARLTKAKHTTIRKDLDALVPSMLERIFQSERCSS